MNIQEPLWFVTLALIPGLVWLYTKKLKNKDELQIKNPSLEGLVKFSGSQTLRHFGFAGLMAVIALGITLIAGFRTDEQTVPAEDDTRKFSVCSVILDNSGSGKWSNTPGGERRFDEAVARVRTAIESDASKCESFGLITFNAQSNALEAPTAGSPVSKEDVLRQLESVTIMSESTMIHTGIRQALNQCKLGEFGPCNFLLASDLADRSDDDEGMLLDELQELKALGSKLQVIDVGADVAYEDLVLWQTPQTKAFEDPTVKDAIELVTDPEQAFANAKIQEITVEGRDIDVPAQTPLLPRLIGGLIALLALVPTWRTIKQ